LDNLLFENEFSGLPSGLFILFLGIIDDYYFAGFCSLLFV